MPSAEKVMLVAELPDGKEYVAEVPGNTRLLDFANAAVRSAGMTANRQNPAPVSVRVLRLTAENGQAVRRSLQVINVTPPLERMTESEYDQVMLKILNELPKEFHSFVSGQAWDEGHSAGLEEVVLIADGLAGDLKPAVEAYAEALQQRTRKSGEN